MVSYQQCLADGKRVGAAHCSDVELMALLCDSTIQTLCGAVSPRLVFEGAVKKGLTSIGLSSMAVEDPAAVAELMWT